MNEEFIKEMNNPKGRYLLFKIDCNCEGGMNDLIVRSSDLVDIKYYISKQVDYINHIVYDLIKNKEIKFNDLIRDKEIELNDQRNH